MLTLVGLLAVVNVSNSSNNIAHQELQLNSTLSQNLEQTRKVIFYSDLITKDENLNKIEQKLNIVRQIRLSNIFRIAGHQKIKR